VIVSGPTLKLHQCGLPKLMALELFKPFIMSRLVERKSVQNIKAAKKYVESMVPEVWDVLEEVIAEHPVLLNRAPTLHRLGIQAFEPVLVEGKAIQIHPLVCHAFNADFDGDQMAVHLPLSAEAQAEARILMLSANNVLSPAHGKPLATPTQDMVIGGYYLTYSGSDLSATIAEELDPKPKRFGSEDDVILALDAEQVTLQDPIEFRRNGEVVLTTPGRVIFNEEVRRALERALGEEFDGASFVFMNQTLGKKEMGDFVSSLVDQYGASAMSVVLDTIKELGFHYATAAGITISKNDIVIPERKEEILEDYEGRVQRIEQQFERGLITEDERHDAIVTLWTEATDAVADAMEETLYELNPIYMMANSGARGSIKQVRQLAGMRGLMANPKGEIMERPIKANFMEGLSVLEYFISTHGARKGLADTALRTADSGYLTRRLVDVSQDVIVREEDCATKEHIELPLVTPDGFNRSLTGRVLAEDLHKPLKGGKPGKTVLLGKGSIVTLADLRRITAELEDQAEGFTVAVRSVLKCRSEFGVCRQCYGVFLATGEMCEIGDAVGIIAAQSIGEPGTQLTMRTFHTGGVAGADITHGLPRVVEIFEARNPKGAARLAEIGGQVLVEDTDRGPKVTIRPEGASDDADDWSVQLPRRTRLFVEDGQLVQAGDPLHEGSLNPSDLLRLKVPISGSTPTELYLVDEVQKVYRSQGVDIHDKHIELIVRQMMKKVRVDTPGDTELLPGQLVDKVVLERENARVKKEKKELATFEPLILGITKASLATESFLSAASFQETTKVLTDAAIEGKIDRLLGLKENVIIGKLIPAATGLKNYRRIEIKPAEGVHVEAYRRPPTEEQLLAALEEIGSDGENVDLGLLGMSFGGEPEHDADGDGMPTEAGEATETPEIESPLDEE
jgi:DNA-directed RNA polymerase subunit beta'